MDDNDGATPGAGGPSPEMLACVKAAVEEVLERRDSCSRAPPARSGVVGPPSGPSSLLDQLLVSSGGWVAKPLLGNGISGDQR